MKAKYVLDAGVLALYFAGDERAKKYVDHILRGDAEGYVCGVNLAEFYYKTAEKLGLDEADIRYEAIRASPIRQVPAAGSLTKEAASIKLTYRRQVSLADAYLIALARQVKGKVLTTDSILKKILKDKCILLEVK